MFILNRNTFFKLYSSIESIIKFINLNEYKLYLKFPIVYKTFKLYINKYNINTVI